MTRISRLTKKAEPPPARDVNRDSGTASANGGWLRRLVRPRHRMNSCHGLPVLSKHRIIASQNRSPQKPAASALKPAAHTTNTKPISKDGAYCHARMMPQRTPRIAPQANCIQKFSRPCLYSLGGWSFITQNQSRENFSFTFGKYSSGTNQSANPQPPQTRSRNLPPEK